ncbi:ribonuclease H-like domain-containing protein [Tanacetum coccineum]
MMIVEKDTYRDCVGTGFASPPHSAMPCRLHLGTLALFPRFGFDLGAIIPGKCHCAPHSNQAHILLDITILPPWVGLTLVAEGAGWLLPTVVSIVVVQSSLVLCISHSIKTSTLSIKGVGNSKQHNCSLLVCSNHISWMLSGNASNGILPPDLPPLGTFFGALLGKYTSVISFHQLIPRIITVLHGEFAMTDLGSLNYFLGISAQRSSSGLFLSQSKFAEEILERAHMQHCNPCRTPVDTESKLGSDGDPVSDPTLYRSLAGALQYLTFTRPDISYAVQQVCLYMHDPRAPHFTALKRILRYVRGTLTFGLQIHASTTAQLTAYTDADWAGCPVTRRSTSGYCVFLGDNLLSWSAKRQVTLSRSSAEAEYRGVANVVAETAWIRNLLLELHAPLTTATLVYCDNVSAVYLTTNPVQHQRTKHIEIDIHFVRDYVASGQVRVLHIPSRFQYADIFTKGLPSALFCDFRSSLNVRRSPVLTAGEY